VQDQHLSCPSVLCNHKKKRKSLLDCNNIQILHFEKETKVMANYFERTTCIRSIKESLSVTSIQAHPETPSATPSTPQYLTKVMAGRPENCNNARRRIKVQEIVYFVRMRNHTCSNHKCKLQFALHITQSVTLIIPAANLFACI